MYHLEIWRWVFTCQWELCVPELFPLQQPPLPGKEQGWALAPLVLQLDPPSVLWLAAEIGEVRHATHETTPKPQSRPLEPSLDCPVPELSPLDLSWGSHWRLEENLALFAKSTWSKGVGQHQSGDTQLTGLNWLLCKEIHTDKAGRGREIWVSWECGFTQPL